jgi:hypothetical protein
MQFLNPLLMWSRLRVPPNPWFRGSLEGIAPEDMASLLGWRDKFSWTVLAHVIAQGSAQRRANAGRVADKSELPRISKTAFKATLLGLRDYISKLTLSDQRTVWDSYDQDNSYGSAEAEAKRQFVAEMVAATKPGLLFDLGCNTGEYSAVAIESGAKFAVGFDFDFGALERAVARADEGNLPLLPLWLDATNPSPDQGWDERERKGFNARVRGDAVLALAFIHHLAIARNIPLDFVIDWIIRVAPVGIIEFPPKSDPMVQRLLSRRRDIFPDYDEQHFMAEVSNRARIVESRSLSEGGRLLVWYDRTDR